jgi:hypothetical protein
MLDGIRRGSFQSVGRIVIRLSSRAIVCAAACSRFMTADHDPPYALRDHEQDCRATDVRYG